MNCQSIQQQLTDYLTGQLDTENRDNIQAHLLECPDCQAELNQLEAVWNGLEQIPQEVPSPMLRQKFNRMLEEERSRKSLRTKIRESLTEWNAHRPAPQFVAGFAIFIIGLVVGYGVRGSRSHHHDLLKLGQEVQSMKQMMSISMLQQESSFDRMKGVTLSTEVEKPGDLLIQMLFTKINSDPSVHVRLSAIDAVSLFSSRKDVQTQLVNALLNQDSPMVQIALIDQIMSIREKNALTALRMLIENQETLPDVKKYAEEKLHALI